MLVCLTCVVFGTYRTDMAAFLPDPKTLGETALLAQVSGDGAASRLILVAIDQAPETVLAEFSEQIASRLRQNAAFDGVLNGDDASIAPIQHFVWDHRFQLDPSLTPERLTRDEIEKSLRQDASLLSSDLGPMLAQSLPADPIGSAMTVGEGLQQSGGTGPETRSGVWMTKDGSRAMLLLYAHASGFDLDAQQAAQKSVSDAFDAVRSTLKHPSSVRLRMSGPGVFAVASRDATKHDVSSLSLLAAAGAILFLLLAYRSVLTLGLALLPVIGAILAGITFVLLGFGYVHAITLGFGVTLLGEALDYSIYVLTQSDPSAHATGTARSLWPTLRLGALVSIAGFGAMLGSGFIGFAQLGLFSMVGLSVAVLVARYVLPSLVPFGFRAKGAPLIGHPLRFIRSHQPVIRGALGIAVIAACGALLTHKEGLWQTDLLSMSPLPPETQKLDTTLRNDLGLVSPSKFLAWRARSREAALETGEELRPTLEALVTRGAIKGYSLPSLILPSRKMQAYRRNVWPDGATLHQRFAEALIHLPFKPDAFTPFFVDVEKARTAPDLKPEDLPPLLGLRLSSMLSQNEKMGWVVLAPLDGLSNEAVLKMHLPKNVDLVDLEKQSRGLLYRFQHEAVMLAVIGSITVIALILGFLRDVRTTGLVILPLLGAVLVTAALLMAHGEKLSIFMIVGFMLIVAVGSNYGLFFARRYESEEKRTHALASIMLANCCTVAAYGILSFSEIPVLHDVGKTVAIGTFLCLLFGAAFTNEAKA